MIHLIMGMRLNLNYTSHCSQLWLSRCNGEFNVRDSQRNYRNQYWLEPRFDQVNLISTLVAEELFDTGVNCGISFTKPLLQRALNLLNRQGKEGWVDLKVDGEYGPATLQALIKYIKNRGKEGEKVLVRLLNIMQGQRYIEITETNPKHEQFFYGWLANRISL